MSKVAIKTETLKKALEDYKKDVTIELVDAKNTTIQFSEENKDLLSFLNEQIPLTKSQKVKISGYLFGGDNLAKTEVGSVNAFFNAVNFLNEATEPVLEVEINSKWYPLMAAVEKWKTFTGAWVCNLTVYGSLGAMQYEKTITVGDWSFEDKAGKHVNKLINEVLSTKNIRIASKESIEHAKSLNKKIPEFWAKSGTMYDATGPGLVYGYFGWSGVPLGQKSAPSHVIAEQVLENQYVHREMHDDAAGWQLPFVRVFSLKHKNYLYVDVEDLGTHVYHRDGKDKIVLPANMLTALNSVFNAQSNEIFGDLFHGRHGGIVVLANGPSGVGKTLTAEVFAEHQERPLYTMEMSEIGTTVKEVEANLQKIFARAKAWNAVLLFDEADIFLSERTASDLERSAIVGIFLRLLDYYEGTFFLTTNRGEGIDNAFKSRVTLYLNYPELTPATRHTIWVNMIKAAQLDVKVVPDVWSQIVETKLNGRQIRNQVRLLKLMYPSGKLTDQNILDSMKFAAL